MGVYIAGMMMPKCCNNCDFNVICNYANGCAHRPKGCPLVEVKAPHGRLGDLGALRAKMYHEAFETDSDMQKWASGCWIRYKMFERMEEAAPTIIPAEEG